MKFGAFYMAVWMWIVPFIIIFYIVVLRQRQIFLRKFAHNGVLSEITGSFDARKRKIKNVMIILAVFFMILSLLRPEWGFDWHEVKRRGLDILIALDCSKSMLAEDVLPNRFSRAKLAIKDLVKKLDGDRLGLIAFSGTAFLQCPLTLDYNGFLLTLDDADTGMIPVGGTALSKVIDSASSAYEGGIKKEKILLIITDGEDLEGGIERAIQKAKIEAIKIFCVGIGSKTGELIPVKDDTGKKVFLKDLEGNIVKTCLVEDFLQRMAIETGGMYVEAQGAQFGLDLIYEEKLSKMEKQELKSRMEKRYHEKFQIFLAISFFLLLLEPLVGDRKSRGVF